MKSTFSVPLLPTNLRISDRSLRTLSRDKHNCLSVGLYVCDSAAPAPWGCHVMSDHCSRTLQSIPGAVGAQCLKCLSSRQWQSRVVSSDLCSDILLYGCDTCSHFFPHFLHPVCVRAHMFEGVFDVYPKGVFSCASIMCNKCKSFTVSGRKGRHINEQYLFTMYDLFSCCFQVCLGIRLCHWRPTFSVQYFCWRMSHLPSLINPFLYGFLRKSLRSRIRRGLERYFLCLRSNRVSDAGAHTRTVHYNVAELPSAIRPHDPEASTIHISGWKCDSKKSFNFTVSKWLWKHLGDIFSSVSDFIRISFSRAALQPEINPAGWFCSLPHQKCLSTSFFMTYN